MQGSVSQFSYGMITPVVAFLTACFGSALGLRCTTRSLHKDRRERRGPWLLLGAICIGSGIWTMHFIAMIGFSITGVTIEYDRAMTFLSLAVAVVVVSIGIFIVGYRGASPLTLGIAGLITGLGVAAMHYIGMHGLKFDGRMTFDSVTVTVSVIIAVVAATAALWAAVSLHSLASATAASVIMGIAVTGMHYTGMAAMSVHAAHPSALADQKLQLLGFLLPVVGGPIGVLVLASVIIMFDPDMLAGGRPAAEAPVVRQEAQVEERPTASWPLF